MLGCHIERINRLVNIAIAYFVVLGLNRILVVKGTAELGKVTSCLPSLLSRHVKSSSSPPQPSKTSS